MRAGFTLIELMVVMVLIGIVTAMILPEMRGTFQDALLRSTGRKLVTACNLASSQAVTANQPHRVHLDLKKGHYSVEHRARDGEGGSGFVPIRNIPGAEGKLDKRIVIELRRPGEDPAAPPQEQTPPAPEEEKSAQRGEIIRFYPDGTADSNEILLRDQEGFHLRLRINPTTGRVRVVERERE